MSSQTVFDIIRGELVPSWTATDIVFENTFYETTGQGFVFVEVAGSYYDQASIGAAPQTANRWREGGILFLNYMAPAGAGTSAARGVAQQLIDIFRGKDISGVTFDKGSIGAGEPGQDFPGYWAMTATLEWQYDSPS